MSLSPLSRTEEGAPSGAASNGASTSAAASGRHVSSRYGNSFSSASGVSPGLLSLEADRIDKNTPRSRSNSPSQAKEGSSPKALPATGLGGQSPATMGSSLNPTRSNSIFRIGRASFGKKKQPSGLGDNSREASLGKSFDSHRSSESNASSDKGVRRRKSESSSPSALRETVPRKSMASSQGADSSSEMEGGRVSSDLDSMVGNGRSGWGLNQSSGSLISDPIAEGAEGAEEGSAVTKAGARRKEGGGKTSEAKTIGRASSGEMVRKSTPFRLSRSSSNSNLEEPKSEDQDKAKAHSPQSPRSPQSSQSPQFPQSSQSPRSLRRANPVPPSIGQAPVAPLPPVPRSAPCRSTYADQRASSSSFRKPNNAVPMLPKIRNSATGRMAIKIKSRWTNGAMEDAEISDSGAMALNEALWDEDILPGSSALQKGETVEEAIRKSSYHDALSIPTTPSSAAWTGEQQVRKTRSQSSFKITRRPSFFGSNKQSFLPGSDTGGEEQPEKTTTGPRSDTLGPTGSGKRAGGLVARPRTSGGETRSGFRSSSSPVAAPAKRSPWDILTASRLDMADSSPEQERGQAYFPPVRTNSTSSADRRLTGSGGGSGSGPGSGRGKLGKGYASASTSRPASPPSGSRLDSSGGAANLFGASSSTSRQRASSLLPNMPWRPRTSSNAATDGTPALSDGSAPSGLGSSAVEPKEKAATAAKVDATPFEGNAEALVNHVLETVSRTEVAAVLASSSDTVRKQALHFYMQRFFFAGNPIDIALRKLLMTLCLPKETQQIDRVMEAFAQRYNECNEHLFASDDQPYVLAFSLMMLHTDAFNRNAKQKMSKQDYLRNTSSCGVQPEILEYLYDNLTFTQFIYVDGDEVLSRRKSEGESNSSFLSAFSSSANGGTKNRIDPYYIIATGQTHTLRGDIASIIPEDTPFRPKGSAETYDVEALNRTFVNAPSIEIVTARRPSVSVGTAALGSDTLSTTFGSADREAESVVTLRVTKVGCISRKDDIIDENRKAQSRKWRTCGMLLSSSQLLFFKDLVWTSALDLQIREQTKERGDVEGGVLITPRITYFRPDGVLALGDAIAVRDTTYTKYEHVFRLIARQGDQSRQYLIQAANEAEINDWIHKINFCAAFRAAGVRIRGLDPPATPSLDADSPRSLSFSSYRSGAEAGDSSTDAVLSSPSSPATSADGALAKTNVHLIGIMRRRVAARRKEVTPRLKAVCSELEKKQIELNEKLRLARHLGILTPFMRVTRDRIEATAVPLSHSIRQLRLEVARHRSRKEILQLELEAGDRAARSIAPAASFADPPNGWLSSSQPVSSADSKEAPGLASLSMLPSPSMDLNAKDQDTATRTGEEGEEAGVATPTLRSTSLGEPESTMRPSHKMRKTLSGSISPALMMNNGTVADSDAHPHSPITPPALSLDRFGHVLDMRSPDDNLATPSSTSTGSSSTRFPSSPLMSAIPREEAERWDRSQVVRNSNRVSLVTLPDPERLKDLSRISLARPPARLRLKGEQG